MHDTTAATATLLLLLAWGGVGAVFFWDWFLRDALRRFRRRSRAVQALIALGVAALVVSGGITLGYCLAIVASILHFVAATRNKAGEYGVAFIQAKIKRYSEGISLHA